MIALRAAHPVLWDPERWDGRLQTFGANGGTDLGYESRSIAWAVDGLYVMANMWWEPIEFEIHVPGDWRIVIDTNLESADPPGIADGSLASSHVTVAPRSIVVLGAPDAPGPSETG